MRTNLGTRRSLRNPLIQRVQRHAALATLFRSPQDMNSEPTLGFTSARLAGGGDFERTVSSNIPGSERSNVPLVSASLIPASSLPAAPDLVEAAGQVSPVIHPAQTQTPAGSTESKPSQPVLQPLSDPGATPVRPVTQPAPQRPPEATIQLAQDNLAQQKIELPAAQSEPVSADDENRIWNRLQSIFRKHQEKQAEEETAAPDVESPQPATAGQPAPIQAAPIQAAPVPPAQVQTAREEGASPATVELPQETPVGPPQQRPASRAVIQEQPLPGQPPLPSQGKAGRSQPGQPEPRQEAQSPELASETQTPADIQRQISADVQPEKPLSIPPPLEDVEASDHPLAEPIQELGEEAAKPTAGERPTASTLPDTLQALPDSGQLETLPSIKQPAVPRMAESRSGETVQKAEDSMQSDTLTPAQPAAQETHQSPVGQATPAETDRVPVQSSTPHLGLPRTDVYAPPDEAEAETLQDIQAMPLESVWPVQRLPEQSEPESKVPLPEVPQSETALPPPSAELASSLEARQVSSLLQDVTPGQPTDSQVEVVTPRRPRPAALPPTPVQTSLQEEQPVPPQPVRVEEQMQSDSAGSQISNLPPHPAESPEGASLVPTEIGALPADLWQLIGQEAPQTQDAPRTQAMPQVQSGLPVSMPVVQRQEDRDHGMQPDAAERRPERATPAAQSGSIAQAASPVITYQAPTTVQRVEVDQISSTVDSREETRDGGGGEEPNMDELSRRVYQEVKRRLANEWERMRRRL